MFSTSWDRVAVVQFFMKIRFESGRRETSIRISYALGIEDDERGEVKWEVGNKFFFFYHLEIVQRRQPRVLVQRRILRLGEGLFHQLRVGPAQYRVDDSGIEVRPPCGWHGTGCGAIVVAGVLDAPT